jgi:hypothetical protein
LVENFDEHLEKEWSLRQLGQYRIPSVQTRDEVHPDLVAEMDLGELELLSRIERLDGYRGQPSIIHHFAFA